MARNITVGIDIGTYQIKVAVAEQINGPHGHEPKIIGAGISESRGLRHGYIINHTDVVKSIKQAVNQAEKTSGQKIRRAFLAIGGIGLSSITSTGTVIISRGDLEITDLDLAKALESSEKEMPANMILNRKIVHAVPIQYKLDGKIVLGQPIGMKGNKLEVKTLFITCLERHLNDLMQAIEESGVEVIDVMASPLAAGLVTLTKTQKIAGCVLANIGAETVSIIVYENNLPVSLEVFPTGSTDITNDIALGLKVALDEAEHIKLGVVTTSIYPRRKLEEIVGARLQDIFELVEAHLKKINRDGLLPAGIVITGGGGSGNGGLGSIEELAKHALRLPSRVASVYLGEDGKSNIKDSSWSVAFGLCVFGLNADRDGMIGRDFFKGFFKNIFRKIKTFLMQFLP
jgi:cell division protein FtsA